MIASIVVSYYPDLPRLASLLRELTRQVDYIFLVDNGSGFTSETLASLQACFQGEVVILGDNYGLGVAINRGIREAKNIGVDFVLLMDQDSMPKPGMVRSLVDSYSILSATCSVAAVGPRFVDIKREYISSHVSFKYWHVGRTPCKGLSAPVLVDFLITSGSLIPMSVISDVGDMDESLFIDHVDTEWVLRAKLKGYRTFGDCRALLEHELGEYRKRIWFFGWREVPVHKPFRYYYIFRNSVILYGRKEVSWVWKRVDCIRLFQIIGFTLIFGPDRLRKIYMMWRGFLDGVKGTTGRLLD